MMKSVAPKNLPRLSLGQSEKDLLANLEKGQIQIEKEALKEKHRTVTEKTEVETDR